MRALTRATFACDRLLVLHAATASLSSKRAWTCSVAGSTF
jgi:hypothetical protein